MKIPETEKAIRKQPELFALDWQERITDKARATIKGAKSVTFIGTGTSYHCALWASWLCQSAGRGKVSARAISAWDFLVGDCAKASPSTDLFVVISHRGNKGLTREVLNSLAKRRRILVAGEKAPTGPHPALFTSPQETSQAHTMSLIGAMCATSEIIAMTLAKTSSSTLRKEREAAAQLCGTITDEATSLGATLGGIITRGADLHFIGGGPFFAVARELSLKAREIIHVPAHAYNTEEFLHGPLASVEEEDSIVLLRPFKQLKKYSKLDQVLNHSRLDACRHSAETVGAMVLEPAWGDQIIDLACRLDRAWQALLPLYWGQILCLSTALAWGIDPDTNRRGDPRYNAAWSHAVF